MFNNCSKCSHGVEHKNEKYIFIDCSIKNDRENSHIEQYDGCPYFIQKEDFVFILDKLEKLKIKDI